MVKGLRYFVVLHELGHLALDHEVPAPGDPEHFQIELEAWEWAIEQSVVKPTTDVWQRCTSMFDWHEAEESSGAIVRPLVTELAAMRALGLRETNHHQLLLPDLPPWMPPLPGSRLRSP